tara:strand:+ start:345 stop:638 length:294 start_codon:yes stop_codon:yes gene_type:complete
MPLKPCYECNNQISPKAIVCPQCGAPQKKGPLSNRVLYSLALIYSVLFWYFFHPFWTEGWVGITRGTWLSTSNFICGLFYIGGFALWNKLYPAGRRK